MSSQADYRKLRKVWYKRLRESGFNDIESNDKQLKGGSTNWKFNSEWTTAFSQQSKKDYYYLATQFMNTYRFDNKLDEAIWAYHAEGLSIRKIEKVLKDAGVGKYYNRSKQTRAYSRPKIQQIVSYYRAIMKREFIK